MPAFISLSVISRKQFVGPSRWLTRALRERATSCRDGPLGRRHRASGARRIPVSDRPPPERSRQAGSVVEYRSD